MMKRKTITLAGGLVLSLLGLGAETAPAGAVVGWWKFNDAANPGKDSSEYHNDLTTFQSGVRHETGVAKSGCYDGSGCLYIGTKGNTASCTAKTVWNASRGFTFLMRSRNDGDSIETTSVFVDKEVRKLTAEISDKSTWHLIAMRYDDQKVTGGTNKYYYWLFGDDPLLSVDDGLAQAVSDSAGLFPVSSAIALGGSIGTSSRNMQYKGYMDDVVIVARTLSKTEIQHYYHTGDPNPYLTSDTDTAFAGSSGWSCGGENLGYGPHNLPGADFVVDNGRTLKALAAHAGTVFGGHSLTLGRLVPLASVVDGSAKAGVVGNFNQQSSVTIGDLRLNNGKITGASGATLTATKLTVNATEASPYEVNVETGTYKIVGTAVGGGWIAKTGAGTLDLTGLKGDIRVREGKGIVIGPTTWFNAGISEYAKWPSDAAKAVGGAWDAGAAALAEVASVDAAGVLDVSAGKGQTLAFNADKAKTPSLDSGRVVIASDMDFSRCEIAEFPSVDPSWKCGVIVGAEGEGPAYYYGLAQCGTTNGWVKLEGPAPTGGTVPLRMTYRRSNGQAVVTYNINGTDYTYGTAKGQRGKDVAVTNIAVVASGAVTGVAYGGCGSVTALSAEAAKLGTSVVVK